jgi:hypothetical protein
MEPSEGRISTQEVLPPYLVVWGPGAGMDPRVPQNRTFTTGSPQFLPEQEAIKQTSKSVAWYS